jgi:predicted nuclease of predicted toxin-antitoxin system
VRFFLDNNLSYRLAEALNALSSFDGDEVVHLKRNFPVDTKDTEWIEKLSKEGNWVVVSGDPKIRRKPAERTVFIDAKLTTFFLAPGWTNCTFWDQAQLLVRWWPKIREQAKLVEAGTIIWVPYAQTGKFSLLPL